MRQTLTKIFLFCFIGGLILVNIITLKDGHNWGDDFSQYIINAKNILAGKPYTSGIMLELPVVYPPGYPLILALLIKFFGVNFVILKSINIPFWYFAVFFLYLIFDGKVERKLLICFCLCLCSLASFFTFKQNVLSDIPFIFFTTASIYFFSRNFERREGVNRDFIIALFLAAYAFLIRSAGVALFAAAFYYSVINGQWKKIFYVILAFGMSFLLQIKISGIHPAYFPYLANSLPQHLGRIIADNALPFQGLLRIFLAKADLSVSALLKVADKLLGFVSPLIYLSILFVFVRRSMRKSISFIGCFIFIYLGMTLFWAGFPHPPTPFSRYCLPIAGLLGLKAIEALSINKKAILYLRILLVVLIGINLYNIYRNYSFNDDVLFTKDSQELFAWVRTNIKEDEHYLIWQAKVVALMTGRIGSVPWMDVTAKGRDFVARTRELKISYIIMNKALDRVIINDLERNKYFAVPVWENYYFKVYKVL